MKHDKLPRKCRDCASKHRYGMFSCREVCKGTGKLKPLKTFVWRGVHVRTSPECWAARRPGTALKWVYASSIGYAIGLATLLTIAWDFATDRVEGWIAAVFALALMLSMFWLFFETLPMWVIARSTLYDEARRREFEAKTLEEADRRLGIDLDSPEVRNWIREGWRE